MKRLLIFGVLLFNTTGHSQENLSLISIYTKQGLIVGSNITPTVKIKNTGATTIHSVELTCEYNGNSILYQGSNLQLAPQEERIFTLSETFQLVQGSTNLSATLTLVNGNAGDDNPGDNNVTNSLTLTTPGFGHIVAIEEATATGCAACPAGSYMLDSLSKKYPDHLAAIAVHGSDPMGMPQYINQLDVGGFPNMYLERSFSPNVWFGVEEEFLDKLVPTPRAVLTNGAIWDPTSRLLQVSVSANFQLNSSNDYKIAIVLTEDSVTGVGPAYNQLNSYSGADFYVGGYELLPNPVPYSMMVYNHVARLLEPSIWGFNCLPDFVGIGETHTINHSFVLPANWDENNIKIISLLVGPNGINNAGKASINEAVANGFVSGQLMTASVEEKTQIDDILQIHPNPATDQMNVNLLLKSESTVFIRIIDALGNTIEDKNYGSLIGAQNIKLNTASLLPGIYHVEVQVNESRLVRKIVTI